jgi:integrase
LTPKTAKRWTATQVAALPPRSSPYTDPGQAGLQLLVRERQGEKPSRTWLLRFKFKDDETRILLGHFPETSLDSARGLARHYREIASQGIDPRRARPRRRERAAPQASAPPRPDDKHTIEFLVAEFVERYLRPTRKRPEYAEAILNRDVLPRWKGRDARTIDPAEVLELLDGIVDRGSKVMANRTAALLTQLFKFGIHRRIVANTPVQLLFRPGGKEKPRERALTEAELKTFLKDPQACTRYERLSHVMLVLLLTGQRRGELALARWSHIDFDTKTWTIPDENAKAGRGHVVPLTDWAIEEFQALQRESEGSPWVLPAIDRKEHVDPKQLTRSVAKCQKRFKERGVTEFTLHDLRRTCRTGLSALKVEPHISERVLNHAQEEMEGVYDQWNYMEEKREALEKWAAHLAELRACPEPAPRRTQ